MPDLLNKTFHVVDSRLSHLAQTGKTQSGCTAVTAFLRIEGESGFINPGLSPRGLMEGRGEAELEAQTGSIGGRTGGAVGGSARKTSGKRIKDFVGRLTGSSEKNEEDEAVSPDGSHVDAIEPRGERLRRVLYTANVGDARAVIWWVGPHEDADASRAGKAVRLTYDHKGSDSHEAKRITDAGGFVMNNRVNGGSPVRPR